MKLRIAGLSMLERGIRTMARAGIHSITIIHPAGSSWKLGAVTRKLDLDLRFVCWGSEETDGNALDDTGYQLLLAGEYVHHHSSLSELMEAEFGPCELIVHAGRPPQENGALLGVDEDQSAVSFVEDGQLSDLANTGAFLCAPGVLAPLELINSGNNLGSIVRAEVERRRTDIRRTALDLWRRVSADRPSQRDAKNMLFSQVTKTTSGFVSRNINARISIPTSKLLVETGLSPHLVTVLFVLTTGLSAAYLVTMAHEYKMLLLAGILWQFAAIFDRCDGEIARIRLCESKFGAWFDTITDNIAYIAAYAGFMIGTQRLYPGNHLYIGLGISAVIALLIYLALAYRYAMKTGSGSLQHYLRDSIHNVPNEEKIFIYKIMERYGFIAKRDFFSFFFLIAAAANMIQTIYWFLIVGLHILVIAILVSQRKVHEAYQRNCREQERETAATLEMLPITEGSAEKAR